MGRSGGWVRRLALSRGALSRRAGPVDPDADWHAAIRDAPHAVKPVRGWVEALRREDRDVAAALTGLQQQTPDQVLSALLVHLLTMDERTVPAGLDEAIDRFRRGPEARVCAEFWSAWAGLAPLGDDICRQMRGLQPTLVQVWILLELPVVVPLDQVDDVDELDADAMQRWRDEILQPDLPRRADGRMFTSEHARWVVEQDDPLLGWQTRAIRDRALRLVDPTTAADVEPFDAVFPWGRSVYAFGDRDLSLLIADGEGSRLSLLFVPARGVLVHLGGRSKAYARRKRVSATIVQLLRRAARDGPAWNDAVARRSEPPGDRAVVVLTSTVANPAHHVWNSYPGIERLVDLDLVAGVDAIHTAGSEFYGPITAIFPELDRVDIVDGPRVGLRDPHPFSQRHVVVPIGSYFITRSVVDRLARVALSIDPDPPPADGAPVLWIGLRTGSRSWVEQAAGVPRLIDAVHQQHPGAVVVLDGFCRPVGRDDVSAQWRDTIDALTQLAAQVRDAAARPGQVVSLVGESLATALNWAGRTDAYLAPVGTSQHRIGWMSDARGVVYGPPSLASRPVEQWPGSFESEGRPVPVGVIGDAVSEGASRPGVDIRLHADNVTLRESDLIEAVLAQLDRTTAP